MKNFWIGLLFALILIFNYQLTPSILEDTQHISAIGYDHAGDHRVKATAAVPFYPAGENVNPINVSYTVEGHTSKSVRQLFQTEAQKEIEAGRINSVVINRKLAKEGILHIVDSFSRDPFIGRDVHLAIIKDTSEEILKYKYPNAVLSSRYLDDLLDQGLQDIIPKTNLHSFLSQYDGMGQDPFLPLLDLREEHIHFEGLALFKNDQYVDSISYKESYLFKLLYEKSREGLYNIRMDDGSYLTIENVRTKVKYNVHGTKKQPKVEIRLSLLGEIKDASGKSLHQKERMKKVEEQWRKETKKNAEKLVQKFQELKIDPLGIGEKVRSRQRQFRMAEWESLYPTVPISISVKVRTIDTGIVE
ncbi:Ger(x)C family spore germination protein [Bacillus xiapuensis]|uniref:Ger(x)C family spore germination protein n=1 Tax=Bacillus xiapuensis TaxID=2014075 RepID=UPI0012FD4DB3|nr:Ger(x)C family spore germination protein [Bacillus xiapuensis]